MRSHLSYRLVVTRMVYFVNYFSGKYFINEVCVKLSWLCFLSGRPGLVEYAVARNFPLVAYSLRYSWLALDAHALIRGLLRDLRLIF